MILDEIVKIGIFLLSLSQFSHFLATFWTLFELLKFQTQNIKAMPKEKSQHCSYLY